MSDLDLHTESVRFELSDLYADHTDPRITGDLEAAASRAQEFFTSYSGKLSERLGDALEALSSLTQDASKIFIYLHLRQSCDPANQEIQQAQSRVRERWASVTANHLLFFELEIGQQLSEEDYRKQLSADPRVRHHRSYLDKIRKKAKHRLSPEVERALILRSPFGPGEWHDYFDQLEVETRFRVPGRKGTMSLTEILNLILHHDDSAVRAAALRSLNRTLGKELAPVMARSLNVSMGAKNLEDAERGYTHPMQSRNDDNKVSAEMVEALHQAVRTEGATQAKRYYRLLARFLGKDKLLWSDRTARVPRPSARRIPWEEGLAMVTDAWRGFSPMMADLVQQMVKNHWVDAHVYPGKGPGAFNYSVYLPSPLGVRSYTFMNYLGTERDIMTLAHEFGHAVHGMLAAEAQGPLMMHAPLAYAETASVFGEMLVFEHLLSNSRSREEQVVLLMDKSGDFLNTVVRQIGFSNFELQIHERRKKGKLLVEDFCTEWRKSAVTLYGKPGEVFDYRDTKFLWAYIGHFFSPFYVYAYAFGELLTQSLFAARTAVGASFEPLYLDLLRAGSTKNAQELLAPFDLDPANPTFWARGIRESLGSWLDRVEQ